MVQQNNQTTLVIRLKGRAKINIDKSEKNINVDRRGIIKNQAKFNRVVEIYLLQLLCNNTMFKFMYSLFSLASTRKTLTFSPFFGFPVESLIREI